MKKPKGASNPSGKKPDTSSNSLSSNTNLSGHANPVESLTLKDYLETATEASRRTRFITIVMVVASVLVLVSVLNSWDLGWITLRLNELRQPTSPYTARKFSLLCKCNELIKKKQPDVCRAIEEQEANTDLWEINEIEREQIKLVDDLRKLKNPTFKVKDEKEKTELNDAIARIETRQKDLKARWLAICTEEMNQISVFTEAMHRSAAETKYTVRAPFFGVAFDINDIGILGGLSLWIVLILLRLSLRNQIVSLRIGFKKARAAGQEDDFYEILAARQMFVFPPLRDKNQKPFYGWIEQVWRRSTPGKTYHGMRKKLLDRFDDLRVSVMIRLSIKDEEMAVTGLLPVKKEKAVPLPVKEEEVAASPLDTKNTWHANRNMTLRIVPKVLSLLPFCIFALQFYHDMKTLHYGNELSSVRTRFLVLFSLFFLLNIFTLGIWCITKWNELDKLWDDYDERREQRKRGKIRRRKTSTKNTAVEKPNAVSPTDTDAV